MNVKLLLFKYVEAELYGAWPVSCRYIWPISHEAWASFPWHSAPELQSVGWILLGFHSHIWHLVQTVAWAPRLTSTLPNYLMWCRHHCRVERHKLQGLLRLKVWDLHTITSATLCWLKPVKVSPKFGLGK